MASLNFAEFERPLSADAPCGPDLDLEGDADFMQLMARVEYVLPAAFLKRNEEGMVEQFDRSSIDFKAEFAALNGLLKRTRDLRLLTFAGRLLALDRNLADCVRCLDLIATLLRDQWDSVHPRGEEGDFGYRMAVLQALDDMPTMVLPLQYLPLVSHRRFGGISGRTMMVATAAASAREDEATLDRSDLERALREADPDDVAAARESARRLGETAAEIGRISAERAGGSGAARLDRLVELAEGMLRAFADVSPAPAMPAPAEEGAAAPSVGPAPAAALPTGAITGRAAAAAALAAVSDYFQRHERSSPAALLVRQAQRLIGLPFHEMLRALVPNHAGEASLYIGPKPGSSFELRIDRIAELIGEDELFLDLEDAPVPVFEVASRAAAVALLREVAAYYRTYEPSSPIPLFTDRACSLVNQDFLSILTDVLPGIRLSRDTD
ncbi:type VI secretion system protein ImpA [Methylobacterium sp. BE186]|uniref:type VI secretion system protein TssA n=1 Tax=Methylobacterium sp. BE186 TaxID=2817715 RepID=UPI002858F50C|nr:type VI secretion system ImpA family N-terminal domain-containing protein [Methylobacterium sp. BE186]MDR7040136.1 type VI secretion system protein ImpA [Methylobacterium sp. BE186]